VKGVMSCETRNNVENCIETGHWSLYQYLCPTKYVGAGEDR
jgi:hypothetical protein